ncbi:retrograde protein of 51 kDa-like isoform X4 [Mizuhopecten yessoensis]|uniref:70 kDa neurofilament protein n=1 Tax=Mizuhopecten yessoensis TaxID=6573 RepID=A0A210QJW4_MIZYE|nr:retrograde protein of 51 kDa-like isoform X4 [Mizuhopecten yessoensis]OWF48901.1 70 kDa neurofilament protein [Mizuhopecten yessoensis]
MSKNTAKLGSHDKGIVIRRTTTAGPHGRLSMGGMGSMGGSMMGGGSMSMSRMSMGGGVRLPPGSASSVTSEHIQGVKDKNIMEKKAIQECNRKLAKRVETEKFLSAQNKILLHELEMLRGKKNLDRTDIEKQCLQEIEAYKDRVSQADKDKAEASARIANLEDQVHDIGKLNETLEGEIAARIKQIERLNTQVGDMEGENGTLRRTVGTQEDEIKRLKMNIQDHKQNLDDARKNLEEECRLRIEAELDRNLAVEERDFLIGCLTKENEELKKLINTDVGQLDIKNLWKGEITSCIKQLQEDNDIELARIKQDFAARYDSQMQQINAGQMKDNANIVKLESEISRLKNKHVDQGPLIADLNAKLNALKMENEKLSDEMSEARERYEQDRCDHMATIESLTCEMTDLLNRFRELQDQKLSLETEIATYRRLLEGEEDSMERFVSDSSGARSRGADSLNDLVQTSSSMGGGSQFSSSSEGKVFIKKKATGHLCIEEAQGSGHFVTLAYGTKEKKPSGPMNLLGWKVCRQMEGDTAYYAVYEFTSDYTLQPGGKMKIFGSNYKNESSKRKEDLVANFPTWSSGGGRFSLLDPSKAEKGFLTIEFR